MNYSHGGGYHCYDHNFNIMLTLTVQVIVHILLLEHILLPLLNSLNLLALEY